MGAIRTIEFPLPEDYEALLLVGNPREGYANITGLYSILYRLPREICDGLIGKIVTHTLENGLSQDELKDLENSITKNKPEARMERIRLHDYIKAAIKNQESDGIPF